MGVFDVAEDAAGADRGELLVVADQPDTRAPVDDELHAASRVRVSAMPASSMITNVAGRPRPPSRAGRRAARTR